MPRGRKSRAFFISHPLDGAPTALGRDHKPQQALFFYPVLFPPFQPGINRVFEVQTNHLSSASMRAGKKIRESQSQRLHMAIVEVFKQMYTHEYTRTPVLLYVCKLMLTYSTQEVTHLHTPCPSSPCLPDIPSTRLGRGKGAGDQSHGDLLAWPPIQTGGKKPC